MYQDRLNLVCFISRDWREYQRKPHIKALSEYANILCVEPPITFLTPIFHTNKLIRFLKGENGIRKIGASLYLFTPFSLVPYAVSHIFPIFKLVNKIIIAFCVSKVLKKLKIDRIILFIFKPHQDFLLRCLNPMLACYEVVDQYSAYPGISQKERKRLINRENKILKKANLVFVTAENLKKDKSRFNKNTIFIPNTTDVEHFSKALDAEITIPEEIKSIEIPRIGFIGNINELMDLKLLNCLAKRRSEWSIIMIGKINGKKRFIKSKKFQSIINQPNIHYLGWRNYEELPRYLKAFDVCLLPYKNIEYMQYVHPNKIYQYLAAGKPVVSSNFHEISSFKQVVKIGLNCKDFITAIEESIGENSEDLVFQRLEVAKNNSADKRARQKIDIIRTAIR